MVINQGGRVPFSLQSDLFLHFILFFPNLTSVFQETERIFECLLLLRLVWVVLNRLQLLL